MKTIFARVTEDFSHTKDGYEILSYDEEKDMYYTVGGKEIPKEAILSKHSVGAVKRDVTELINSFSSKENFSNVFSHFVKEYFN